MYIIVCICVCVVCIWGCGHEHIIDSVCMSIDVCVYVCVCTGVCEQMN